MFEKFLSLLILQRVSFGFVLLIVYDFSEMGHLLDGITNIAVNGVSKAIEDNVKEEETEFGGVKVEFC